MNLLKKKKNMTKIKAKYRIRPLSVPFGKTGNACTCDEWARHGRENIWLVARTNSLAVDSCLRITETDYLQNKTHRCVFLMFLFRSLQRTVRIKVTNDVIKPASFVDSRRAALTLLRSAGNFEWCRRGGGRMMTDPNNNPLWPGPEEILQGRHKFVFYSFI